MAQPTLTSEILGSPQEIKQGHGLLAQWESIGFTYRGSGFNSLTDYDGWRERRHVAEELG
jgi:hypothetical protein